MDGVLVTVCCTAVSLLSSLIVGLVAHGWRGDMATLRAEVRASIAESGLTFYEKVNGNYVKKEVHNTLVGRVDGIEQRVNDAGD